MADLCDTCMHLYYDDEWGDWLCGAEVAMDEDDVATLFTRADRPCPYYRPGDEYTIVRKQN